MKFSNNRKKGFVVGMLLAALMLMQTMTAWALPASGVSAGDNVLVRETAVSGAKVGSLSTGQEVSILDETDGTDGYVWYAVSYTKSSGETVEGWVRSDLLIVSEEAESEEDADSAEETESEEDELSMLSCYFSLAGTGVTLCDIPNDVLAEVLDTGRFTETVYVFSEGTVNALQLTEPLDELATDDSFSGISDYFYVYGYDDNGIGGWYILDGAGGSLQKNLSSMTYTVPDAEITVDSVTRMMIGALAVICLLLLILTIIFSVRYRKLRGTLEKEETDGVAPSTEESKAAAIDEPIFYDDDDDLEFL